MAFYNSEILSYICSQIVQTDIIILIQKLSPLIKPSVNEMMFTPLAKPHWRSFASCQSVSFHCTEQPPGRLINCQSLGESGGERFASFPKSCSWDTQSIVNTCWTMASVRGGRCSKRMNTGNQYCAWTDREKMVIGHYTLYHGNWHAP